MLILSVDTTSENGGAGIYRDAECLASIANPGGTNYSISLFDMVDHLLAEARSCLEDMELFAVANGPGSFTGIRVGLAAAQGWAKAFGRPAHGVSVLEAMVEAAAPRADIALPLVDARRGEFYLCPFRRADEDHQKSRGDVSRQIGPLCYSIEGEGVAMRPAQIQLSLRQLISQSGRSGVAPLAVCCVTREQDRAAESLRNTLSGPLDWKQVPGVLVGAIASLALRAHRAGKPDSPNGLDAYYIRRSDAELHWRE